MYQGHFATALLIKAAAGPSIPAWPILIGSSVLDLISTANAFLGLDVLSPSSTAGPYMYTDFTSIDWSHSLLLMVAWAVVFGWVVCHAVCGFSAEAALVGAASCVVHWAMDVLVVAPSALALYPRGHVRFGMGMYARYPVASWVAENLYCVVAAAVAVRVTKRRTGADTSGTLGWIVGMAVVMSPWLSPLLLVARLYERGWLVGWALAAVQMVGFWIACLVPAVALSRIIDREERAVRALQKKSEQ